MLLTKKQIVISQFFFFFPKIKNVASVVCQSLLEAELLFEGHNPNTDSVKVSAIKTYYQHDVAFEMIEATKQNIAIVVPRGVTFDSSKYDHVIALLLKYRVMSPLLGDLRGHGNANDHFLWPRIWAGVKGHSQQLPTCEPWSAADAQPGKRLNSTKTSRMQDGAAKHALIGATGHGSNLELRQPGVRARSGVAAGHGPSFDRTDGERDKSQVAGTCASAKKSR